MRAQPVPGDITIPFDASDTPTAWSLNDVVHFRERMGSRIHEAHDWPWIVSRSRFWNPLLPCAPRPTAAIDWPSRTAIGFQCAVDEPCDATSTTAFMVVSDLPAWNPGRINSARRREVRRALERYEFTILRDPGLLIDQGWRTLTGAAEVSGQVTPADEDTYRAQWAAAFSASPPLVVAATRNGTLQSYVVSYAALGHATLHEVVVAPWGRGDRSGSALYGIHTQLWSSLPGIQFLNTGRQFPERGTVDEFKLTMGATVLDLPIIARMRAPVARWLKARRPVSYHRLVGRPLR